MSDSLNFVEEQNSRKKGDKISFRPGDTINVHYKIKEGSKERIQQFQGVVLQIKNRNSSGETFTVRKISNGIAVERIFPTASPNINKIEVLRNGNVRRAKLYYLRDRKGKSARIAEKIKKKIGIDISTQPDIPEIKTETTPKEETKVDEKKKSSEEKEETKLKTEDKK